IYYTPKTKKIMSTPLLILPPWINKYYIFDLKPENSFVRWAVAAGIPVFIVSWINPDERHAHKTLTDYVLEGAQMAMNQVIKLTHKQQINAMGYCTGGILLSCLMTYLNAKGMNPIKSASIVATPVDFREAGDLLVYVCEQQLKKLKDHVAKRGFLEGQSMVQSFNLLRANDLIWSFYVNNYLMGKDPMPFDMLHWNCDAVRMPATMHTDYLRWMYLENRLMQPGGITIEDIPVDLSTINVPMFIMAAIDDHIAPWRSVYPLTQFPKGETRFVLSGSGHVAGVFNHPDKKKYHHWFSNVLPQSPDEWLENAEKHEGSWWPLWRDWLEQFSGGYEAPKKMDKTTILEDAPGSYVKMTGE
ncbi:MAG TPA: alpha/beta fold hydrolase, partial [Candidatus Nitrosotenuis sp.]|nr:alpha/beta fold hydrolase [Candidatus Nitrosotenuis sp.]